MARTAPGASSDAHAPYPPHTPANRVNKSRTERSNSRSTRQRARVFAAASSAGVLQNMVEEAQEVLAGACSNRGKGKGRADPVEDDVDMTAADDSTGISEKLDVCPITDKEDKPFPIMDLPAEIRLEIYRACLTRPYQILLSKREQQQTAEADADEDAYAERSGTTVTPSDADDTEDDVPLRQRTARQQLSVNVVSTRRSNVVGGLRSRDSRGTRATRLLSSRSAPGSSINRNSLTGYGTSYTYPSQSSTAGIGYQTVGPRPARRNVHHRSLVHTVQEPPRNQTQDPLLVNILRASKEIYKEARSVLYSENFFTLDLNTAISTLYCLHQRSRRQIKHVELEIPNYNEILERFQETVRLSLRYCSGLKKLVIHMPFTLPGADGSGTTGNTAVYANGFDILRWLPQECDVILKGNICTEIETVVNKHLQLAKTLDKFAYARRQLISNDTGPAVAPTATARPAN